MLVKKRYCFTTPIGLNDCPVGWGSIDERGLKSCCDEPIEDNCRNIVEIEEEVES